MLKLNKEPCTEIYGDIIKRPVTWDSKPALRINHKTHQYYWAKGDLTDKSRYLSPYGGFKFVKTGCCCVCEQEIIPYAQKYFQKHYDSGCRFCFELSANTFFCEECAKEESKKEYVSGCAPVEVSRFTSVRDNRLVETKEYADGSKIEELTDRELARRGA